MLTPKQTRLAEAMVENVDLNCKQLAELVHLDLKTITKYKKIPEFQDYVHSLCQAHFADLEKAAMNQLTKQINNGNWKAVQYVLDGRGYKPADKIEVTDTNVNVTISGDDDAD